MAGASLAAPLQADASAGPSWIGQGRTGTEVRRTILLEASVALSCAHRKGPFGWTKGVSRRRYRKRDCAREFVVLVLKAVSG
jgi:hypothetical protein